MFSMVVDWNENKPAEEATPQPAAFPYQSVSNKTKIKNFYQENLI